MDALSIVLLVVMIAAALVAISQYQRAERVKQRSVKHLEEAKDLREKQESLRTEINDLRKEKDRLTSSLSSQKKKSRGVNKKGDDLKAKLAELKGDKEKLQDRLKNRQEVIAELRDRMDSLEGQLAALDDSPLKAAVAPKPAPTPDDDEIIAEVEESPEAETAVEGGGISKKALLDAQLEAEKFQRRAAVAEDKIKRLQIASDTANSRFRDTLKKLQRAERLGRRTQRQEADHRRMLSVIKDRYASAVELLHNLEVQHGAKIPDAISGELRRLTVEEVVEYEPEQQGRRRGGQKSRPAEATPEVAEAADEVAEAADEVAEAADEVAETASEGAEAAPEVAEAAAEVAEAAPEVAEAAPAEAAIPSADDIVVEGDNISIGAASDDGETA